MTRSLRVHIFFFLQEYRHHLEPVKCSAPNRERRVLAQSINHTQTEPLITQPKVDGLGSAEDFDSKRGYPPPPDPVTRPTDANGFAVHSGHCCVLERGPNALLSGAGKQYLCFPRLFTISLRLP